MYVTVRSPGKLLLRLPATIWHKRRAFCKHVRTGWLGCLAQGIVSVQGYSSQGLVAAQQ